MPNRATTQVSQAHLSNFLHPVVRYFDNQKRRVEEHHIIEDFLTDFSLEDKHIQPLNSFLEKILSNLKPILKKDEL